MKDKLQRLVKRDQEARLIDRQGVYNGELCGLGIQRRVVKNHDSTQQLS